VVNDRFRKRGANNVEENFMFALAFVAILFAVYKLSVLVGLPLYPYGWSYS
jgi:hypothetical protein